MTSVDRVKRALNHEQVDRVPRLLYEEVVGYTQPIAKLLAAHCGSEAPRDYFRMDLTRVLPGPTRLPRERFEPWLGPTARDAIANGLVDEWGVVRKPEGVHELVRIESPLRYLEGIAELEKYPWPDLDKEYRFESVAGEVDALHGRGFAVVGYAGSVFERAWYLRGFEQMFVDLAANALFADALLERTAGFQRQVAVRFAKAGVDIVLLGDDIAGQRGLLMSLSTWRKHLKPHLKATVAAVKSVNPDVFVCYHSDGNVEPAVPDLIEIGVDVLNPVQPECLDVVGLHKKYGRAICFWGTVSVQRTMPFASPEQVKAEVAHRIRTIGASGGLILSPAHRLGPEVPWANIVAFFEASEQQW
ncbi:MAG: hypothetical protein GX456_02255 [Verrucomicrobia bacterium]|nr:hypothetical protein [Verrucomicrobiota bacterium]